MLTLADLPPWLVSRLDSAALIERYGCTFLACVGFKGNAHLDHFLATDDLRPPTTARYLAKLKADPIASQRERLRRRVDNAKRATKDAEGRIAEARAEIASSPLCTYTAELTLRAQLTRLEERSGALKRAETDLELYDLMHP